MTDFGLGGFRQFGLVLVNLAAEPEYCEKLMYARGGMTTPAHTHRKKKEDIICRWGRLEVQVWNGPPAETKDEFEMKVNGEACRAFSGELFTLEPGERVTLEPGVYHEFKPATEECIIGEVSTANDDWNDNLFAHADIGRFPEIEEDEEPIVRLIGDLV